MHVYTDGLRLNRAPDGHLSGRRVSCRVRLLLAIALAVVSLFGGALCPSAQAQRSVSAQSEPRAPGKQQALVSGVVLDAGSGEALPGATVIGEAAALGTATDRYGRFTLALPRAPATLRVSYVGYLPATLVVRADTTVRIALEPAPVELGGVAVTADRARPLVPGTGTVAFSPDELYRIPSIGGEVDPVKAFQLMPGVSGGREGSAGLFVRGGSPDQNLVLLDGAPVYNASHLLGFLSTFHPDALRSVELTKGAGSAQYGGRLSSVLDVALKEGDRYERRAQGAVGLVSARALVEGPIRKGRSSYLFALRRTYADALWRFFQTPDERAGYYFYDGVAKASTVGDVHGLYASFYGGRDRFWTTYEEEDSGGTEAYRGQLAWGNVTGTLRWQARLSPRLRSEVTAGFTDYRLGFQEETDRDSREGPDERSLTTYGSGVTDGFVRFGLDLRASPRHRLRFGADAAAHLFRPSASRAEGTGVDDQAVGGATRVRAASGALYAEDAFELGRGWSGTAGLRGSAFATDGAAYGGLEPRIGLRKQIGKTTVEASYARARQYVHLVSRSGVGIPLDLWLPTTDRVGPQRAWQAAAEVQHALSPSADLTIGAFVKRMRGVLVPADGASLLGTDAAGWEDRVEVGDGLARGGELLLRKRTGRLTGWIAYTLAWSTRTFPGIDGGRTFPQRYDRRHDAAITAAYQLTAGWTLSGTWVYATGDAIWLPVGRAPAIEEPTGYPSTRPYDGEESALIYGPRNGSRAPSYHRLDLSARHEREVRGGTRTWTLGVYNAYARRNPFFLYARTARDGALEFRKVSPFVLIPALTYERTF